MLISSTIGKNPDVIYSQLEDAIQDVMNTSAERVGTMDINQK